MGRSTFEHRCVIAAQLLVAAVALRTSRQEIQNSVDGDDALSWEWAISEAVAEAFPLRLPSEEMGGERVEFPRRSFGQKRDPNLMWAFGSHHKAGTDLLRGVAAAQAVWTGMEMCSDMGKFGWEPPNCNVERQQFARVFFSCDLTTSNLELFEKSRNYRAVHIIRDPLAMLVSGYIFHQNSTDTPDVLKVERNLSVVDGLAVEANFVLTFTGASMVDTYLHAPANLTLHVRFESFVNSSSSFDATTKRIYDFTVGDIVRSDEIKQVMDMATLYDLRRHPQYHPPLHVSDPVKKEEIKKLLNELPPSLLKRLKEMREILGYV